MGNSICIFDADRWEQLGRVLDGGATAKERRLIMQNLNRPDFEECFMVALRAMMMFNINDDVYETV